MADGKLDNANSAIESWLSLSADKFDVLYIMPRDKIIKYNDQFYYSIDEQEHNAMTLKSDMAAIEEWSMDPASVFAEDWMASRQSILNMKRKVRFMERLPVKKLVGTAPMSGDILSEPELIKFCCGAIWYNINITYREFVDMVLDSE